MKSEAKISGNRIQITRVFDAPRPLVFAWCTQAEKLQQWSGCKAATKCEIEMDFRVGGSFTENATSPERVNFRLPACTTNRRAGKDLFTTRILASHHESSRGVLRARQSTRVVLTHDGFPNESFCKTVSEGTTESLDKLASMLADQALVKQLVNWKGLPMNLTRIALAALGAFVAYFALGGPPICRPALA